jgi:hypothetical protein
MRSLIAGGMVFAVLTLASPVHAEAFDLSHCEFPQAPAVPNGGTASEAEMASAGGAVRAYIDATNGGLECLSAAQAGHGTALTADQQQQYDGIWDAAVDAMEALAASYNEQVRAYRAANPD